MALTPSQEIDKFINEETVTPSVAVFLLLE
jgi:hypothetical protein